jgi:hypothetical protein
MRNEKGLHWKARSSTDCSICAEDDKQGTYLHFTNYRLTLSNPIFLPPAYSPALIYFGWERGWWITCNYPTVLKEKNINRNSTYIHLLRPSIYTLFCLIPVYSFSHFKQLMLSLPTKTYTAAVSNHHIM